VTADPASWHRLLVTMRGAEITVALDGAPVLRCQDATFPQAGRFGLWTKADASSEFDLLEVAPWPAAAVPATTPAAATPWQLGYDGALFARSADGRDQITLGGLLQVDYTAFERSEVRPADFELRRMRPELAGRFDDFLRFQLEPDFTEDEVELEEAWIGAELGGPDALLMLGRMKAPFGLEEVRSRRHIDFPRFSILNQFSPAEDHGVFVNGRGAGGLLEYGVAAYNGTGGADTQSSKDVAARLMLHPWHDANGSALQNMQFGLAATWGRQDVDASATTIDNAFAEPVIAFAPGARLDGDRVRLGAELAWFDGPVMAQAEALLVRQHMRQGGGVDTVEFTGAYVNVGVVLTGEAKSFRGVRPDHPVGRGGAGAFVLAARASVLHCDQALQDLGLVVPTTFTSDIRSIEVGLNWVLNEHALVRHAYVHSFYGDDVTLGSSQFDNEGAFRIEWQLHF